MSLTIKQLLEFLSYRMEIKKLNLKFKYSINYSQETTTRTTNNLCNQAESLLRQPPLHLTPPFRRQPWRVAQPGSRWKPVETYIRESPDLLIWQPLVGSSLPSGFWPLRRDKPRFLSTNPSTGKSSQTDWVEKMKTTTSFLIATKSRRSDWSGEMIGQVKRLIRWNDWSGEVIGQVKWLVRWNDWSGEMKLFLFNSCWFNLSTFDFLLRAVSK